MTDFLFYQGLDLDVDGGDGRTVFVRDGVLYGIGRGIKSVGSS